jgi:hypothetical protein
MVFSFLDFAYQSWNLGRHSLIHICVLHFHLPPIAARAAVSGQSLIGLRRAALAPLPASAFLPVFISELYSFHERLDYSVFARSVRASRMTSDSDWPRIPK